jgi:hypothetical protein
MDMYTGRQALDKEQFTIFCFMYMLLGEHLIFIRADLYRASIISVLLMMHELCMALFPLAGIAHGVCSSEPTG